MVGMRALLLAAALAAVSCAACTRGVRGAEQPEPEPGPVSDACADPGADGAVSEAPDLDRADRDLNGSGTDEIVVADRELCTPEENCHWNIFWAEDPECLRFVGTISGVAIEAMQSRGDKDFADLRGWWQLPDEGRMLMQEYTFRGGGYRVETASPCAAEPGGRVVCAEGGGPEAEGADTAL